MLTREQLDRCTSFAHADDGERAALYALVDERDLLLQLAAVRLETIRELGAAADRLERECAAALAELADAKADRDELTARLNGADQARAAYLRERDEARALAAEVRERFISRDLVERALEVLNDQNLTIHDAHARAAALLREALGQ